MISGGPISGAPIGAVSSEPVVVPVFVFADLEISYALDALDLVSADLVVAYAIDAQGLVSADLACAYAILNGGAMSFEPSIARTVKILPNRTEFAAGAFWAPSTNGPVGEKDPDAVIDIPFDWTPWLDDIAPASLASAVFILTGGLQNAGSSADEKMATIFVSGGSIGLPTSITCRITTATTPSRTDERTVYLTIKDQ